MTGPAARDAANDTWQMQAVWGLDVPLLGKSQAHNVGKFGDSVSDSYFHSCAIFVQAKPCLF